MLWSHLVIAAMKPAGAGLGSVIDILIAIPLIIPRKSIIDAAEALHRIICAKPGAAKFS